MTEVTPARTNRRLLMGAVAVVVVVAATALTAAAVQEQGTPSHRQPSHGEQVDTVWFGMWRQLPAATKQSVCSRAETEPNGYARVAADIERYATDKGVHVMTRDDIENMLVYSCVVDAPE